MEQKVKRTGSTLRMMRAIFVRGMKKRTFAGAVIAVGLLETLDVLPVYMEDVYVAEGVKYVWEDILNLFLFGGYTLFQLVAVSVSVLPFGFLYCEDKQSHMLQMILQRSSTTKYAFVNMLAGGTGTFITVFCGEMLFVFLYTMAGVPLHGRKIDGYVGDIGFSLVEDKQYVQLLLAFILLRCLRGAFFGMMSILLSAYVKNKWIIASLPIIFYYFLMRFGYGQLQLPAYLNIRGIYWMFVLGDRKEWLSIVYTTVITAGLYILFSFWLEHKIRREPD